MKKNVFLATTFVAGLITMGVAQFPSNNSAATGDLNGYLAQDTVPKKDTVPDKDSSETKEVSFLNTNSYMAKDTVPKKDTTVPDKPDSTSIRL